MNNEFEKTKQLLEKWSLPVGEEKIIKIEIGEDSLTFRAKILSASEIAKLRRIGLKPDGTVDLNALEEANDEFIRRAILEPKVDPKKLHPHLRDLLLEELLKLHGYSEDILQKLEKKLKKSVSGSI